jgi:hypothetical protein
MITPVEMASFGSFLHFKYMPNYSLQDFETKHTKLDSHQPIVPHSIRADLTPQLGNFEWRNRKESGLTKIKRKAYSTSLARNQKDY